MCNKYQVKQVLRRHLIGQSGIILTAPPSLTWKRVVYFRVVGILQMVAKRGRYLYFATHFKIENVSV